MCVVTMNTAPGRDGRTARTIGNDSSRSWNSSSRYAFYRSMERPGAGEEDARRVFGGEVGALRDFPAACALLDRRRSVRCSGSVLGAHWVLTAAHCVTPQLAHVAYNTRRPAAGDGDVAAVHFLYRHPKYRVQQEDDGRGPDVTTLLHDVGLVRTRRAMRLAGAGLAGLAGLRALRPDAPYDEEVQVLGFGRTERAAPGEELCAVRLRLARCGRAGWRHCVCGAALRPRGVCSGDSGGPVLYRGLPIGVTSMGPVECAQRGAAPAAGATSVFTALQPYADVIEATIRDADDALREHGVAGATVARATDALWPLFAMRLLLRGFTCETCC